MEYRKGYICLHVKTSGDVSTDIVKNMNGSTRYRENRGMESKVISFGCFYSPSSTVHSCEDITTTSALKNRALQKWRHCTSLIIEIETLVIA